MSKNDDITLQDLLPTDRKYLMDDEAKVGTIRFTAEEKRELLKLTTSKGWEILRGVYVKQRLVQIAAAGINLAQNLEQLHFYKGKSAEVDYMIKQVEAIARSLREEEDKYNKPKS